jgi:hypothetical protein
VRAVLCLQIHLRVPVCASDRPPPCTMPDTPV